MARHERERAARNGSRGHHSLRLKHPTEPPPSRSYVDRGPARKDYVDAYWSIVNWCVALTARPRFDRRFDRRLDRSR